MTRQEIHWTPPPRPDWLERFNAEGLHLDLSALVPLDPAELIATARRSTGLDDFGDDAWREPFQVLVRALEQEAALTFFGRLMTRNDLLNNLRARLEIEDAYRRHPEIADEVVDRPLIIAAVPRSGSSILFELLALDPEFGSPRQWEMMYPVPPPETASYDNDPRIERCEHVIGQWTRVAPSLSAIHEFDARLPNECIFGQAISFISEYWPSQYQIPSYIDWLTNNADWADSYLYYKRLLKVLQWRNPRHHWLLKAPSHLNYLPTIFDVFPDARVLLTHRDPIVSQASVTNLMGTLFWIRSERPMEVSAFAGMLAPEAMAFTLDRVIEWLESGAIPAGQCMNLLYTDLLSKPVEAVRAVYGNAGLELSAAGEQRIRDYLAAKPQGKHGRHTYDVADPDEVVRRREIFRRYQDYFHVPSEV